MLLIFFTCHEESTCNDTKSPWLHSTSPGAAPPRTSLSTEVMPKIPKWSWAAFRKAERVDVGLEWLEFQCPKEMTPPTVDGFGLPINGIGLAYIARDYDIILDEFGMVFTAWLEMSTLCCWNLVERPWNRFGGWTSDLFATMTSTVPSPIDARTPHMQRGASTCDIIFHSGHDKPPVSLSMFCLSSFKGV